MTLPPGPSRLARFFQRSLSSRDALTWLTDMARQYGDVVQLDPNTFLISHPEDALQVMGGTHRTFAFATADEIGEVSQFWGTGLPASQGTSWRHLRQLLGAAFDRTRLVEVAPTIVTTTARLLEASAGPAPVALQPLLRHLLLHIATLTHLGCEIGERRALIQAALDATMQVLEHPIQLRLSIDTPDKVRFRETLGPLDELLGELIRERRQSGPQGNDLLSRLVVARDEHDEPLPDQVIRDQIVTMLRASHKNAATVLTWALWLLDQHPHEKERVRAESRALAHHPSTSDDLPSLPLTDAALKEASRLYPLYWALRRKALTAWSVRGYQIPAGSWVVVSPWVIQRDARFFPDPTAFRPARWQPEGTPGLAPAAYLPFGAGPRRCPVATYAQLEMILILATLLHYAEMVFVQKRVSYVPSPNGLRPQADLSVRLLQPTF